MHGKNRQQTPELENGLSAGLEKDLKDGLDWQWLKVGSDSPFPAELSAHRLNLVLLQLTSTASMHLSCVLCPAKGMRMHAREADGCSSTNVLLRIRSQLDALICYSLCQCAGHAADA